jgi:hypothetical protein
MTISSIDRHRRASRSRAQQPQDGSAAAAADSETSAADETGNRALHDVASGPNPNVGRGDREDIERPTRQRDDGGGVEST